jgi:hypothetical protein
MWPGYYYRSNDTSTRWTDCTNTTGTTPTDWYFDWPIVGYTTVSDWPKIEFVLPKWWRWYDIFRTWAKPKLLRLLDGAQTKERRVQERYPLGQRRKQKRRACVQRLHAL